MHSLLPRPPCYHYHVWSSCPPLLIVNQCMASPHCGNCCGSSLAATQDSLHDQQHDKKSLYTTLSHGCVTCIHKTTIWRRYTLGRNSHGYPGTNHYPVPPDGLKGLTDDAKHKLLSLELLIDFRGSSRDEPRHERAWANRTSSCKHTYVVRWSTQFRACITRNFHVNERPIDKTEKTYLTLWHTRCIWRVAK